MSLRLVGVPRRRWVPETRETGEGIYKLRRVYTDRPEKKVTNWSWTFRPETKTETASKRHTRTRSLMQRHRMK